MIKNIAIVLSFFPGSLLVLSLVSFVVCAIAEMGLPGGSANIGLGLLLIAFFINIPTFIVWGVYVAKRRNVVTQSGTGTETSSMSR